MISAVPRKWGGGRLDGLAGSVGQYGRAMGEWMGPAVVLTATGERLESKQRWVEGEESGTMTEKSGQQEIGTEDAGHLTNQGLDRGGGGVTVPN